MSEFAQFMRRRLPELILLTITSAALFSTITFGFHIEDALRANWPVIILLPLCIELYLTAVSYSPRSAALGSLGFVLIVGVAVVGAGSASGHAFFYDEYGNLGFFVLLGAIVTALGHALTRRKTGALLYAACGCFTCAVIEFLYTNGLLAQLLVFLVAAIPLCVVCFTRQESKVIAQDDSSSPRILATGAGIGVVALAVSCAIFALVIAPLNPPAQEIKLVTEYYALETVHVRGMQTVKHKENDELISNNEEESDKQTNKENDNIEEIHGDQSNDAAVGQQGQDDFGSSGYSITGFGESTQASDYLADQKLTFLLGVALVLLLIAASIFTKLALRARRYRKMTALPPVQQVQAFYRFFDKRFALLGIERNPASTPLEHAENSKDTAMLLEANAPEGASFATLAKSYSSCTFGNAQPDDAALDCCKGLYGVFYKNVRSFLGLARYLARFFKL